jgi:hypothetical protein
MDFWEPDHKKLYGVTKEQYKTMPPEERAALEARLQSEKYLHTKKCTFPENFARTYHPEEWQEWIDANRDKDGAAPYWSKKSIAHWTKRFLGEPKSSPESYDPGEKRDQSGKWTSGGGTIRAAAGKVMRAFAQAGKAAGHAEHVATDRIGKGVEKLPGPLRKLVKGAFYTLYSTFIACEKAAKAVAREIGGDEHAEKVAHALTVLDNVGAAGGKGVAAAGFPPAALALLVPVASVSYLAFSTATRPLATFRAAKKAMRAAFSKIAGRAVKENAGDGAGPARGDVELLVQAMTKHKDRSDWFLALVAAAAPYADGDAARAVELAEAALADSPEAPAGEGDE